MISLLTDCNMLIITVNFFFCVVIAGKSCKYEVSLPQLPVSQNHEEYCIESHVDKSDIATCSYGYLHPISISSAQSEESES